MSAELDFIRRKGGTVILYGGHQNYKVKQFKNESELWRCSSYKKLKCKGNIDIRMNEKRILTVKDHACPPDLSKNEVANEIALLKDKIKESTRPVPELYERTINKLKNKGLNIVTALPQMSSIQHCLYDVRNKALCVNKTTLKNLEEVRMANKTR